MLALGFPGWCRLRSAPTCVLPRDILPELYSILRRLLLVLGLGILRRSQAVKLIWLLLLPGVELTDASCSLFERIWEVVKYKLRPAIHMEKQLGWAYKLGGVESLGFSKVG